MKASHYPIIIVGSGPAGSSLAAALVKKQKTLSSQILIIEKEVHPRPKLCGGGLSYWVSYLLEELDLQLSLVPTRIEEIIIQYSKVQLPFPIPGIMHTVLRSEFDYDLVEQIKSKGVNVIENCRLEQVHRTSDEVTLETNVGKLTCDVLVGADGAKSTVRRLLFKDQPSFVSRLMEYWIPVESEQADWQKRRAILDFDQVPNGLQGYTWTFPSFKDDRPYVNVGIFDSRVAGSTKIDLMKMLEHHCAKYELPFEKSKVMAHPERWLHRKVETHKERVLLTGEAAGIEPWLGEGIAYSMGYAPTIAESIIEAFETEDFTFANQSQRLKGSLIGRKLKRNRTVAKLFYHPLGHKLIPTLSRIMYKKFKGGVVKRVTNAPKIGSR